MPTHKPTIPTPIAMVAAIASGNAIGKDGALPWHIPEDLKHFRTLTMGGAIIMGRRTFDSIGKPLPGRLNIVLTRTPQTIEGCEVATTPDAALAIAQKSNKKIHIIGGEQIYRIFMPKATTLHITDLTQTIKIPPPHAKFPPINKTQWHLTKTTNLKTIKNATFQTYTRH